MKLNKAHIVTVTQEGRFLKAFTPEGLDVSNTIPRELRRKAVATSQQLQYDPVTSTWSFSGTVASTVTTPSIPLEEITSDSDHADIRDFIHQSVQYKPKSLVISDLKWKYLVRSAMRGKNIMMTGEAGTGKTVAAKYLVTALQRPDFYFNLGATQDPRATLIGNTHFSKDSGTYFSESLFVKAIQTENAVILLDELSRAHPEAWNILMTVLDQNQRYLRLDEKDGAPTIKVAKGVSFIATANIGNAYTSTRKLDRALEDRFVTIEMDELNAEQEFYLLKLKYPLVPADQLHAVADIASSTRLERNSSTAKISNAISTRVSEEIASLLGDGFTLTEAAEVCIYPFFSADGGLESERTFVTQLVQKHIKNESVDEAIFQASDAVADEASA